jgi:hypothetical protein
MIGTRGYAMIGLSLTVLLALPCGSTKAGDPSGDSYAERGNCTGCPPIRKAKTPPPMDPTRQAKRPPAAKTSKDDLPLPEKCKYAMPEEPGSEALKIQCNKAGYPTPHWPTRGATADPQPASEPESLGDRLANAARQLIQSEYDKAHGLNPPPCHNSGTAQDVQDILSGCQ